MMNVIPNDIGKKRRKSDSKQHIQLNKCLNEKRRREQENIYIEELAELISASLSDMSSLSVKPDKCAILQETVKQIRIIKQQVDCLDVASDDLQASEVSSSRPTILANDVLGPLLLEALDGFLFIVNTDGIIEFVSENVTSFLKFAQSELVGKSIYNIIHVGDHPRFSSNLLPMSAIGNGFGWSETQASTSSNNSTTSASKSRCFNSRFMVKPQQEDEQFSDGDDSDPEFSSLMKTSTNSSNKTTGQTTNRDNKCTQPQQFENMQISAVLVPSLESKQRQSNASSPTPGTTASSSADDNCLVCVARRIPVTDKSAANVVVEQFTTRLDLTGKILAIDTSGVSSTYSQYLNKELVGKPILELCHPNDLFRVQSHLKDALSTRNTVTSGIYRLMVTNDKYVHVQTKSKIFNGNQSVSEPNDFIMATHSIIRDSENSCSSETSSSRGGTPSPITTSSWSGNPTFASTMSSTASSVANCNSSTNMISSLTARDLLTSSAISRAESIPGPVIYANTQTGMISTTPFPPFPALSPSNVSDFSLNDCLGISEMFPSSSVSWDNYDTNSQESQQQTSNTTTVQTVMTNTGGHSSNRTPTPTSAGMYVSDTPPALVPVTGAQSQQPQPPVSQQTSPLCASSPSMANLVRSPSNPSPQSVQHNYNQSTNNAFDNKSLEDYSPSSNTSSQHKLRNLLTHGMFSTEEADSSPLIKKEQSLQNNDNILRELLDQEEEAELSSVASTPNAPTSMAQPHTPFSESSCPGSVGSDKKVSNNNNMLRMLLNDDDIGKRSEIRKNHELVEQLLKDNDHHNRDPNSYLNQHFKKEPIDSTPCSSSSSLPTSLNEVMATSMANKRKSIDETSTHYEPQMQDMKRPASVTGVNNGPGHQHQPALLAGQNPMLASMLARTPTSMPDEISIPTSIISQTPDAKLPRNLEKKLIPTPLHPHPVQQSGQVSQSGGQVIFTSVAPAQGTPQSSQPMMVPIVTNVTQLRPQQMHSFGGGAQRLQIQPQVQQPIRIQEIHLQQIGPQSQTPVGHQLLHQQQQQQIQQQNTSNFLNRILSDSGQTQQQQQQAVRALMHQQMIQQQQQQQQQPQLAAPAPQQTQAPQPQTPVAATTAQNAIQLQSFYQPQPQQALQNQPTAQQSLQSASNPPQLLFEESASDPYLSSILDDFISMQQEMNLDVPTRHRQTPVTPQTEDVMLLRILEEVIEPSAPNVATPSTPTTPADLNERMAISAIQKQLMSFEVTTPTSPNMVTTPFPNMSSATAPNYQQIPPPAYTPTTYGQQIANSAQQSTPPAPANFQLQPRPQGPRISKPRQQYLPQNMQLNPNLTQVAAQVKSAQLTPHQRRSLAEQRKMMAEQQKRLLAQQSQQQMIPQTQQTETMSFSGFPENMNELLNNSVAPNVALTVKPRPTVGQQTPSGDASQLSPRYAIPITAVSSPLPQSPAPQLSPGPRAPFSPAQPAAQQSYPSPSGNSYPTANQHRMSPHFASSPSPANAGPNSPLMQMSPQTTQWPQAVRPQTQMSQPSQQQVIQQSSQNVSLQQTNPMLNAQLSGNGPSYANTGQRFPPRPMRAAAPPQPRNARSSPYPEQFGQQFVGQQSIGRPTQRMNVSSIPSPMRVNSPRFPSESSLPSPNYQTVQSYPQSTDQFNFDQSFGSNSQPPTPQPLTPQSVQQTDRSRNNSGMTSEYVKQEIRSLVSGRTQQQQQIQTQPQQQQQHQLSLSSQTLTLSSADLDMFSLLSDNSDDFTQGLLNIGSDNNNAINSPVSHLNLNMNRTNSMDDSKPTDQKKSLLQQLLSEPS